MDNAKKTKIIGFSLACAATLGVIGGVFANKKYQEKKTLHPDDILELVKNSFIAEGPIEGAWIEYTQNPLKKYAINYLTHTGGITRKEVDTIVQYEFIADAKTGSILDVYQIK